MKNLIFLFSLLFMQNLMAQFSKLGYEVELGTYLSTPISSSNTHLSIQEATAKLGYDIQFNFSYRVQKKIALTLGAGLHSIGDRTMTRITKLPITKTESIENFYYLKIPIGVKYTFGKSHFFAHPSFSFNFFAHHQSFLIQHLEDGRREKLTPDIRLAVQPAEPILYQVGLNIGRDFGFDDYPFSAGVKTYYALSSIKSGTKKPWYGIGVFLSCQLGD